MEMLKQKLSSRKLWAAILAAIAAVVAALFGDKLTPEIIDAIETVSKIAIAYIFAEGSVDISRLIADAIKEKYAIPSIGEIISDIKSAEEAEKSVDSHSDN